MKLISMVDFVLEQNESIKSDMIGYGEFIDKVVKYAKFLKQPLTLGMFVPCDESGNVLKEPERWLDFLKYPESFDGNKEWYDLYAYQQAKERVLFEGFEVKALEYGLYVTIGKDNIILTWSHKDNDFLLNNGRPIERFVGLNLTLTRTAVKQIYG